MKTVPQKKTKVAMITSWNCRCGIAEYARYLMKAVEHELDFVIYANLDAEMLEPDDPNTVYRCWRIKSDLSDLFHHIVNSDVDIVHLQFNYAFFNLAQLSSFIEAMAVRKKMIITLHATKCTPYGSLREITDVLKKIPVLIVHQAEDCTRLQDFGLHDNVTQMQHGIIEFPPVEKQMARGNIPLKGAPVIATFGFMLPHKGLLQLIQTLAMLKQQYPSIVLIAACALYPHTISTDYYQQCLHEIKKLQLEKRVLLVTDFLSPDAALSLLSAADITVLAYHPTFESSSAALRFCMAARRPLITTKLPIFAEIADCSYQVEECNPTVLTEAIGNLLNSPEQQEVFSKALAQKVEATGWSKVGREYIDLIQKLSKTGRG